MMTKEGSIKIVTPIAPGTVVLVLRRGYIRHIVKIHYLLKNPLLYSGQRSEKLSIYM